MPFVALDRDWLGERWEVREWHERTRRVNLPALAQAVRECELVFGWFASWHTFWPFAFARLFNKPSVLVVGGYDVANLPEIAYGHQRGGMKKWVSRSVMRLATHLTTYSHYNQQEIERNIGWPPHQVQMISLGVPDPFKELPPAQRDSLVLTVGHVDRSNLRRKGHAAFVRSATNLPDVSFALVGRWADDAIQQLRAEARPNVTFTGWVPAGTLHAYYRRASVYVQASQHEGFGLALAEAMLAGCVPVVTPRGAIAEVVGEAGCYVESDQPAELARVIAQALNSEPGRRRQARERILSCFPPERRRQALHTLIDQILEAVPST
jgi:glycosyltransferase involved in cell wall biosynthesis